MNEITTIGIDLAKNGSQVHGVDARGAVVVRKAIRRVQVLRFFEALPRCLVGMEACATAHYWARAIAAVGHEVRLMPPQYVKAYVKRNKNDAVDAEAICEAVHRPSMRFVAVKSAEQQAVLTMHRARDLLMLGRISKRGDGYVRRLLVTGALTALTRSKAVKAMPWIIGMKARAKRPMVIAVALANKMARTAWAMMVRATAYRASAA